ncbi:MAG: ABC transporter permease, partial [Bacteroidota bacterium]
MFKNYFHTAIKVLLKHRVYSLINIVGLTLGLCACMVVATVVIDDLSYDKQWSRSNDLYRVVTVNKMGEGLYDRFPSSLAGLAPELKKSYPEVESYGRLAINDALTLKIDDKASNVIKATSLLADTSVWSMLDFKIIGGNPKNYIDGSTNLVISESFRDKYFAGQNPVGRIIHDVPAYGDKPGNYLITGIIKDIPSNTHLRADVIQLQKNRIEALQKEGYGSFTQNYLLMRPGTDIRKFQDKINTWYKRFIGKDKYYQFEFQPLKDVYLHSDFASSSYQPVKGSVQNIYIFSGVALLLLIIACVNFINLSTARATTRLRETGVRKILGAKRSHIVFQFLAEAILFFTVSSILAIIFYQLSLNPVQSFLGHTLSETFTSHLSLL